jgi:hypothetical protein
MTPGIYGRARAIETRYANRLFRSRLEARWALFFDEAGIRWDYEPEGFELPVGRYLPDFWLPEVGLRGGSTPGVFVEVKPAEKLGDAACEALAKESGKPVILVVGLPRSPNQPGETSDGPGYQFCGGGDADPWWDNFMCLMKCEAMGCGYVKWEFFESNYMKCPRCGADASHEHPALLGAYRLAAEARFSPGSR